MHVAGVKQGTQKLGGEIWQAIFASAFPKWDPSVTGQGQGAAGCGWRSRSCRSLSEGAARLPAVLAAFPAVPPSPAPRASPRAARAASPVSAST